MDREFDYPLLILTLLMLRLLSYMNAKIFENYPCYVGIHRKTLAEYSRASTNMPEFQSFFRGFLHHFLLAKFAPNSIGVNNFIFTWDSYNRFFVLLQIESNSHPYFIIRKPVHFKQCNHICKPPLPLPW